MDNITAFGGSLVLDEIEASSRAARAGVKLLRFYSVMNAIKPLLALLAAGALALLALAEPTFAQSVLNGDATKPVKAVRTGVEVAMWVTLAMGVFGLCWMGWNKIGGKAWGGQAVGSAICLGISGVIAFINMIVNGGTPDLGEF
jgi:hypothetical protein